MYKKLNYEEGIINIGNIYYFDHRCYYAFDITFSETTSKSFGNMIAICADKDDKKEAQRYLYNLKRRLARVGIKSGEKVHILTDENNDVLAITKSVENFMWIDVKDKFVRKRYCDLF